MFRTLSPSDFDDMATLCSENVDTADRKVFYLGLMFFQTWLLMLLVQLAFASS